MASLFDSLSFRNVTMRNRIGVSPMCQYSSTDGLANDWHLVHLGARAAGGAGLVFVEATAVEARGRISPADMGLWNDAQIEPLARIARFLSRHGAVPAIQLAHAGRKASTAAPWDGGNAVDDAHGGWTPIGPGDEPFPTYRKPHAMSEQDIADVQIAFIAATQRALEAGFTFIELHAAHGYLAHSFLSPLSNHRTDRYGGSLENRMRFTIETAAKMRAAIPQELPLAVRLSCSDWVPDGWDIEQSVELSRRLKKEGVDLIDCSSGGLVPNAKIELGPGYQVPFAEAIKRQAGIATAAVGMITDPHQAQSIIAAGQADMVLLGREMLRDPYWAIHAARALEQRDALPGPVQYGRAL